MTSINTFTSEIINGTSVTLFWDGTYNSVVLEKSLNDTTYSTYLSNYTNSSYTFKNLVPNTVYYFRVTPCDLHGNRGQPETLFVITPFTVTISSFNYGVTTTNSIPLQWTGSYYKVMIYYKRVVDINYQYLTTVIGTTSYIVSSLAPDTSYNFYIVPYDLNNQSGPQSSTITAYTDYNSYVTNINLGNITSNTIDLNWNGVFSFVKVQISKDNGKHFVTDTNLIVYDICNNEFSSYGSCTISSLMPYTTYYFRLIPYSENYNIGTTSYVVSGKTLMGITSFTQTKIGVDYVTFNWSGIYTKVSLKKVYNNNTYTAVTINSETPQNTTNYTYTLKNLLPYQNYQFYLLPYDGTTPTTSTPLLTIITDFSAQVNAMVDVDTTYNAIPILFDTSGVNYPYYSRALIKISTDGLNYYDVSFITQHTTVVNEYKYYVKTYGDETTGSGLKSNVKYYFKIVPISMYDVSGYPIYFNGTTKGHIEVADIYLDNKQIVVNISGIYSYVNILYSQDPSFQTYSYVTTSNKSYKFDAGLSRIANYFRIVPYNSADVSGVYYNTLYNPVITKFYISNIDKNTNTLTIGGNYSKITIQSATRLNSEQPVTPFVDLSTIAMSGSKSITFNYTHNTCLYYRIIPYYKSAITGTDASGIISNEIFTPLIKDFDITVSSRYDFSLNWWGIYDYAKIQYSKFGSNEYYDLCSNYFIDVSSINTFYVKSGSNSANNATFDLSGNSYNFRIIPYSIADTSYNVGIPQTTFNASIRISDASANSAIVTNLNTVVLYYTGVFNEIYLYFRKKDENYTTEYIEITDSGSKYYLVNGLNTDTTYYFKMVPYNSQKNNPYNYEFNKIPGWSSPEISVKTRSMLSFINLNYDISHSTPTSIRLTWVNANYNYLYIYNVTNNNQYIQTFTSSLPSFYNSNGIEELTPNTNYIYRIELYDNYGSMETTTISVYTLPNRTLDMNLYYTVYNSGVTFYWNPVGYNNITIKNLSTNTTTIITDTNINYYDSFDNENSAQFLPNTEYTYQFTTTNNVGITSTNTTTITTMAQIAFSVLYTAINSICIRVHGFYSGFMVHIGESPETIAPLTSVSNIFEPTKFPISMLYYYPFDADIYDYHSGVSVNNATSYGGASITTSDSVVGLGSLYFDENEEQYLSLTPISNSNTESMTLAFWFKTNNNSSGAKIFDFGSTSGSYRRWYLCVNDPNIISGNAILYYCYEDDFDIIHTTSIELYNLNNVDWTHLAITMNKNDEIWKIYINGSLFTSQSGLYPLIETSDYNYIGKSFVASDAYFNGNIEDFRIYTNELRQEEIQKLYNMARYDYVFNVNKSNTTYYIQLAPENGAGSYGTLTSYKTATTAA